jgi:thiamine pyrophosphokinase
MSIYAKVVNRMSNRDLLHFNEASCKGITITLVHTDGVYLIESEKEANVLYKKDVHFRYMIEFKHIKQNELRGDFDSLSEEELVSINKEYIDEPDPKNWTCR